MKKLKIIQPGYHGYTGPIGRYEFVDGISVDAISRPDRDQLATAFQFMEVDEHGKEEFAGITHRMVAEAAARAPILEPLKRDTEEDKAIEQKRLASNKIAITGNMKLHSREDLEAVASKSGIAGLRKIAELWHVKHRSIPSLIEMILDAQALYTKPAEPEPAPVVEPTPDPAPAAEAPAAEVPAAEVVAKPVVEPAAEVVPEAVLVDAPILLTEAGDVVLAEGVVEITMGDDIGDDDEMPIPSADLGEDHLDSPALNVSMGDDFDEDDAA